jgi:hypothetical protein
MLNSNEVASVEMLWGRVASLLVVGTSVLGESPVLLIQTLDDELRNILMVHAVDRSKYGSGGSLKLYQEEMMKIVFPFDPAIV